MRVNRRGPHASPAVPRAHVTHGLAPWVHHLRAKRCVLRKTMDCRVMPGNDDGIVRKTAALTTGHPRA